MKTEYVLPVLVFLIAFLVKEYNIEKGNFVIWDEAHFGKFSQNYLSQKFYTDVHPPLGKLLTAASGYIFGQSDDFLFSNNDKPFPVTFDYVGMRRFHAFVGSLISVSFYFILRLLNLSKRRAFLGACLTIFENSITVLLRLIVLDSHLLAFMSFSILGFIWYKKSQGSTLSMLFLGVSMGCVVSIKWLACLTMLYIGLYVIYETYNNSITLSCKNFLKFFFIRVFFFILIPILIYLFSFYIHLKILKDSNGETGDFSVDFNFNFLNNSFAKYKKFVSYGRQVTIKMKSNYLHSHNHVYPEDIIKENEINKYQATAYAHKDQNGIFYFQKVNSNNNEDGFIKNGDEVVLLHELTKGYLGGDNKSAYIGQGLRAFFENSPPTDQSVFIIELEGKHDKGAKVISLFGDFYLKQKATGKYLSLSGLIYPAWGHKQSEILLKEKSGDGIMTIEENLFSEEKNNFLHGEKKSNFISNIIELNKNMHRINSSLTQDPNEEPHSINSQPWEWFILFKGLRMTQWIDEKRKFYLFMNPLTLYTSSVVILYSFIKLVNLIVNYLRFIKICKDGNIKKGKECKRYETDFFELYFYLGGYIIHYFPFFFIRRVLYIHHYLPAYYFAMIGVCKIFSKIKFKYFSLFVIFTIINYLLYSPLSYGFYNQNAVKHISILPSWTFIDKK